MPWRAWVTGSIRDRRLKRSRYAAEREAERSGVGGGWKSRWECMHRVGLDLSVTWTFQKGYRQRKYYLTMNPSWWHAWVFRALITQFPVMHFSRHLFPLSDSGSGWIDACSRAHHPIDFHLTLHSHVSQPRTGSESAQTFCFFSFFRFFHSFLSFCYVDSGDRSADGWEFHHARMHRRSAAVENRGEALWWHGGSMLCLWFVRRWYFGSHQ